MANAESYKDVLAQVRDRLNSIDERQETQDRRLTEEMAGVRKEIGDLRMAVNHQLSAVGRNVAVIEARVDKAEEFKASVITLKSALCWLVATAISVAGVASGVAAAFVKVFGG